MKRQTGPWHIGLLWTQPYRAKTRPASPNHVRSVLLCDITQHRAVILHWHFGTTYRSQFHGSRNPKERREHDSSLTQSFFFLWGGGALSIVQFLKDAKCFGSWLCFCFQGKQHLTWCNYDLDWVICNHWEPQKQQLVTFVPDKRSSSMVVTGKLLLKINYKT